MVTGTIFCSPLDCTILLTQLGRFTGALMFNTVSFLLPAAYMTLSKLWVANINSSLVATTDVYIYIGVIAQVFNEGLPRAAWVTIGDASSRPYEYRLKLSYTLIFFQSALGLIISMIFAFAAKGFANGFLPPEIRAVSLDYVRISSFSAFSSALEVSVANTTRALDKPNVPLLIGTIKIAVNIVLDMLIISQFHVGTHAPTINAQAWIRLACDMTAAFSGLIYFLYLTFRQRRQYSLETGEKKAITPSFSALKVLAPPGITTFLESAVRNALYLWLVTRIVSMGSTYATAWGVFNTIRWGLLMVPVQALEATALTFVGHAWGQWRSGVGDVLYAKTMRGDLFRKCITNIRFLQKQSNRERFTDMIRPALISAFIALVIELPICLFLTLFGWRSFARYLSGSDAVATLTFHMWRTIDWYGPCTIHPCSMHRGLHLRPSG